MDIKLSPMQQKLHDLFPAEGDIPEDCRVLAPLHQRSILLNGEMQIWKGETRAVFSPVHVRAADGSLTPDDAVAYAARILQDQLSIFVNFEEPESAKVGTTGLCGRSTMITQMPTMITP